MTVAEADAVLGGIPGAGARKSRKTVHYSFDASLQFEVGESGRIQFIGLASNPDVISRYNGHDVFDTPAPELFELIAAHESVNHEYDPSEYLFPDQIITLYEADEQYDQVQHESRPIWGQVGVGNDEYLAAIRAIRGESAAG